MKRSVIILSALLCSVMFMRAQDAEAAPKIEIPLTAYISAETDIMPAAESLLLNRMRQAALKNGLAAVDNQPYIVTTSVNVIDKQVTGGVPAKWVVELEVHFFIGNGVDGTLYASTALNRKGIGESEQKAYLSAIKAISASDRAFKPFFEKGKKRIIEELEALRALEEAQQAAENENAGVGPSDPSPADEQPLEYNFNWQ
jgi:hypothetical protein